ncbi:MAG: HPr family phosphocarrier protein, partial [Deltaproteobacteria bacterium]|nr:HPr family phosphocarrier protein [Deltaproteobacteria bacterium]
MVAEKIEVNIPTYMGFHVRPATLVMKIVKHYGSEMKMQLDDEVYD